MAEHAFGFEDTLAMVPQSAMAKVSHHFLCGVKPIVDGEVVSFAAAPSFY
jgi:hypothetical protein